VETGVQTACRVGWILPTNVDGANETRPSRIRELRVPSLPPLSPPPTATVFPDELPAAPAVDPVAVSELVNEASGSASATTSAPAPQPISSSGPVRADPALAAFQAGSGHSPTPPPEPTASLGDILPRQRPFSGFSPPTIAPVADWIPSDTYNPASQPGSPRILMPLESDYATSLPQLPAIPNRPADKRRKGNRAEDKRKDLAVLAIEYQINPLSGGLAKSTKCLTTEDWKIAAAEMRHVRAMERIDAKKDAGRWSLRQPRKLRGPAVPKAHWDYLLEEMVGLSCSS